MNQTYMIVFFDGYCNLCSWSVQFIIRHDRQRKFRFAPLQGTTAKGFQDFSEQPKNTDSVFLWQRNRMYSRSAAALRIAKHLDGLYPLLFVFILIPAPIRDWCYDFIAARRYRWFGKNDSCMMPSPELRSLFLD